MIPKFGNSLTEREFEALKKEVEDWVLKEIRKRLTKRNGKLFSFYGCKKGGYLIFGKNEYIAKKEKDCLTEMEAEDELKYKHQIASILNIMISCVMDLSEGYDVDIEEIPLENSITEFRVIRAR